MIVSPDSFYINDVSSETVGLYVDTPPVPPMAKQRYTQSQVGADSDMITPDDSFESIQITIKCYTFFREDFDNRDIYGFVFGAKTLKTSRFEDCYYKVQSVSVSQPASAHNGQRVMYNITFTCKPFKYAVDNDREDVEINTTVDNFGNRYSKPSFSIEGTGDITLVVQGQTFTITGLNGTAIIDSEKRIAYTNTEIINQNTNGDFPILYPGLNTVYWEGTGTVTRVTVQKNVRWY